jgi:hypothetical protein
MSTSYKCCLQHIADKRLVCIRVQVTHGRNALQSQFKWQHHVVQLRGYILFTNASCQYRYMAHPQSPGLLTLGRTLVSAVVLSMILACVDDV